MAPLAPVLGTLLVPSQHSSLSGTRTVRTFHVRMAEIDVASIGPSHIPLPWMHANSPPERFTPSSRYAVPDGVSSLLTFGQAR